jgi:hypothetical protein
MRPVILGVAVTLLCYSTSMASAPAQKRTRPWVDAKGISVFPLGSPDLPATREQFLSTFLQGWQSRLFLPAGAPERILKADGDTYPALDHLRIDLSNAAIDPDKPTPKLKGSDAIIKTLSVANLELLAKPMLCRGARFQFDVAMTAARFELQHDKSNEPLLVLADVKDGRLDFSITKSDLDRLLFESAKAAGDKYGVNVKSTQFKMKLEPRAISVELKVETKVGFVPASMKIKGRIDIDDQLHGKLSKLSVDGDFALQPLISTVIRPGLERYEGRDKRLIGFPTTNVKLKDLKLTYDDTFHAVAAFGS